MIRVGTNDNRRVRGCGRPVRDSLVALWMMASAFGALIHSSPAQAHVIMGTPSLHLRIVESKLIVRARVVDPQAWVTSADRSMMRELVEIRVLETLKGQPGGARIRFAQDGHAVARYAFGDEALFFLKPIGESRELKQLDIEGGATHVSSQEHDEIFLVSGSAGEILLTATRMFVASESVPDAVGRVAMIRAATLELLASGDGQLGAMALASLVLTPQAALVTKADLPRLEPLLADPAHSIGFRAGLLAQLERRGLVSGPPHWLALLEGARPNELGSAIRAAGANPSPLVVGFLLDKVADPEAPPEIVAEAAIALGRSGDPRSTRALKRALARESARVRTAAIRGLGQLKQASAKSVLEEAAISHVDSATRRRARAELRSLERSE